MISLSVFWWQEPLPVALDSRGRPCAQQGDPAQPKWPMFVFLVCAFYTFGEYWTHAVPVFLRSIGFDMAKF